MKRFTLLNIILFTLFMILFAGFRLEGFYSAIFMRQDLPHYLVLVPFFAGTTIFMAVYQGLSIDWKDLKNHWQNVLAILVTIMLGICLIFASSFYIQITTPFQYSIVAIFAALIAITSITNLIKSRK